MTGKTSDENRITKNNHTVSQRISPGSQNRIRNLSFVSSLFVLKCLKQKIMKPLIKNSLVLLFFIVLSCNNEDENAHNPLVGNWVMRSATVTKCTDTVNNGSYYCSGMLCEIIIFGADNTGVFDHVDVAIADETFTYTQTGSTLKITYTDGTVSEFNYSISYPYLTLTDLDSVTSCESALTYQGFTP